jgi:hypothetical protein
MQTRSIVERSDRTFADDVGQGILSSKTSSAVTRRSCGGTAAARQFVVRALTSGQPRQAWESHGFGGAVPCSRGEQRAQLLVARDAGVARIGRPARRNVGRSAGRWPSPEVFRCPFLARCLGCLDMGEIVLRVHLVGGDVIDVRTGSSSLYGPWRCG